MTPWIQIAGIRDAAEAAMLVGEGVEWLGFPLRLAYHKEDCSDETAAAIIRSLPPRCRGVLITYLDGAADIAALCAKLGTRSVQLHGDVRPDEVRRLRDEGTYFVMKSLVVEPGNEAVLQRRVEEHGPLVDAFITDTFDPATGARGATGKAHDWGVSRRLVEVSPKPVILAGGLTPDNVARAIREVRPAGVDAHTGVEGEDGRKSRELVRRFVQEARRAFGDAGGEHRTPNAELRTPK